MSLYDIFETDPSLETEGIWVRYGEAEFKIARAGGANKRFGQVQKALMKPYERLLHMGKVSDDDIRPTLARVFAQTVIKDWKGVCSRDGDLLEFSEDNVVTVLTDLPELFTDILENATSVEIFARAVREEQAKN